MSDVANRYARQEILPEVGPAGQAKLRAAHIVVVGAGGLGCPVLQYLVGAGVGRISIVDDDVVALSNLHRQPLYRMDQIGQYKAEAAATTLGALNLDCEITPFTQRLDADNVARLISQADVVLDCADSFAASYILSDACFAGRLPFISASVLGLTGYVGGFCAGAPSLRAVFPDLPERAANCSTAGVMGPVVGAIGALQAQMALAHIINQSPAPLGQMLTLDCSNWRTAGFRFDEAPEPDGQVLHFIAPSQIADDDFVVELRDVVEAPVPVTAAAHRHLVADFQSRRPAPLLGQRAVLCCRSGLRAWQAATNLQTYWTGEISLVAVGDAPKTQKVEQ
jgi:molybdopterin/thiamine biosynthesis adenylyltransferase